MRGADGDGARTATRCTAGSPRRPGRARTRCCSTIHGGPFAQYGWTLFDETQAYVSAGYAVVQCNPRGSSGYGAGARPGDQGRLRRARRRRRPRLPRRRARRPGARRRPGRRHGRLLRRLPDDAPDRPHRRGSPPPSASAAFIDPVSFVGSSDIGWIFPDQYLGTDPARIAAQSAMTHAHRRSRRRRWSSTPRRTGAARSSRAPGSTSSSSAAACRPSCCCSRGRATSCPAPGRPRHRLARLEHVLRWWARWLPTAQNPRRRRLAALAEPAPSTTRRRGRRPAGEPLTVRATRVD